ncbi:MAG: hypothetical protein Q9157_009182, partial [Trypethelium eluteriae]
MPQLLGEVSLLTLYDSTRMLDPPTANPPHHRFEKGSYVYLFHNPAQHQGRIEIANNAGTAEQDAFAGSLANVQIKYSYRHPTLFTIVVDPSGMSSLSGPSANADPNSTRQWHLPAPDPRNEGNYLFRLNEIDIYFWTMDDASTFLDNMKRVLQAYQISIRDSPTPLSEHRDTMSSVVQKLEQVAVTKPFQGRRSDSLSTNQSSGAPSMTRGTTASSPPAESQNVFVPMAYNPAAPAAPEPIKHREKTPPPID